MDKRVAVVTGSNKGIGLGIVKALCQVFQGDVILTARDEERGKSAVAALSQESLHPKFHQLDITDRSSIIRLKNFLFENYGGLDMLVNNAGVYINNVPEKSFAEKVEEQLNINYFANVDCFDILRPILRPHARVCNVSSMCASQAIQKCSPDLVAKITDPNITFDELTAIMNTYIRSAKDGTYNELGFPDDMYGFSKVGLTVATVIQQRELDQSGAVDIVVNACTPGFVKTDINRNQGELTIEEGIVTPMYCVLLPQNIDSPRGLMLRNKEPVDWVTFYLPPIVIK